MERKLKMWIGNLDGERQGLVIAPTKERAREVVGTGRSDFDAHWVLQNQVYDFDAGVLYTRPLSPGVIENLWERGRCVVGRRPR